MAAKQEAKLLQAAQKSDAGTVKSLLKKGINASCRNDAGQTPLHLAMKGGKDKVVRPLLENRANVRAEDDFKNTPLHEAARHGHDHIIDILCPKLTKLEMNVQNRDGQSALHIAIAGKHKDAAFSLIRSGCTPDVEDRNGKSPLDLCTDNDWKEKLVKAVKARETAEKDEDHKLFDAAANGDMMVVFSCLTSMTSKGAEVVGGQGAGKLVVSGELINQKNEDDQTAIFLAVCGGQPKMVGVLLDRGADVNVPDRYGRTPLHYAASEGDAEMAKLLLKRGKADPALRDHRGRTVVHHAAEWGHNFLLEIFLAYNDGGRAACAEVEPSQNTAGGNNRAIQFCDDVRIARITEESEMTIVDENPQEDDEVLERVPDAPAPVRSLVPPAPMKRQCTPASNSQPFVQAAQSARGRGAGPPGGPPPRARGADRGRFVGARPARGGGGPRGRGFGGMRGPPPPVPAPPPVAALPPGGAPPRAAIPPPIAARPPPAGAMHLPSHPALPSRRPVHAAPPPPSRAGAPTPGARIAAPPPGAAAPCVPSRGGGSGTDVVDVNALDNTGMNALHLAATHGRTKTCTFLIERGCVVNAQNHDGWAPLHYAAYFRRQRAADVLLAGGADINAVTGNGETALHLAVQMKRVKLAQVLVARGADLNIQRRADGKTALHIALELGLKSISQVMLEKGADVDVKDAAGKTALDLAPAELASSIEKAKEAAEKERKRKEEEEKAREEAERERLHELARSMIEAAGSGNVAEVESYLAQGCDPNDTTSVCAEEDEGRISALQYASKKNHLEVVRLLLSKGAAQYVPGQTMTSALHLASAAGHMEVLHELLAASPDLEIGDKFGSTALHCAALGGHLEAAEALIEAGISVNALDEMEDTPLHCACLKGHVEMAKMLLGRGANALAVDGEGQMPIDWAEFKGFSELIDLLSQYN